MPDMRGGIAGNLRSPLGNDLDCMKSIELASNIKAIFRGRRRTNAVLGSSPEIISEERAVCVTAVLIVPLKLPMRLSPYVEVTAINSYP